MKRRRLLALLLLAVWPSSLDGSMCPGAVNVPGYGTAQLTNTGHAVRLQETSDVALDSDGKVIVPMNGRTYFARSCTEGAYEPSRYAALNLRGRKMKFTVDLSGAGCGCNVAFYLVSMAQNTNASDCGDYYCDANKVCGVSCSEIDIMEANRHAWHTTLHSSHDRNGLTDGYGGGGRSGAGAWTWSGPRSFTNMEFGPAGECVDTGAPFQVEASFPLGPTGALERLEIALSQQGKPCTAKLVVDKYSGMDELSAALWQGMTPVASYWRSKELLWLDGLGSDSEGPCSEDTQHCSDSVRLWGFTVEDMDGSPGPAQVPALPPAPVPARPQVSRTPDAGAPAASPTAPPPSPAPPPPSRPAPSPSPPPSATPPAPTPHPSTTARVVTTTARVVTTTTRAAVMRFSAARFPRFAAARAPAPAPPPSPKPPQPSPHPSEAKPPGQAAGGDHCAGSGENCRKKHCCQHPGHQCYERDWFWAECQESCSVTQAAWSCKELGSRTPLLAGSVFGSNQAEPRWGYEASGGFVPVGYANVPKLEGGGSGSEEVFRAAPPSGQGVESSEGSSNILTNWMLVFVCLFMPLAALLAWCVLRGRIRDALSRDGDDEEERATDGDEEAELDKLNSKGDLEHALCSSRRVRSSPGGAGEASGGFLSSLGWLLGCTSDRQKVPPQSARPQRPPGYFGS